MPCWPGTLMPPRPLPRQPLPTSLLPAGTENLELLAQPGRSDHPVTIQHPGVDYREVLGKWVSLGGGGVLRAACCRPSPRLCLSRQC